MSHQMPIKMDDVMESVLDAFAETDGYGTTGYIVEKSGSTRPTVTKRLDRLYAAGCLEYVHEPTAFWRLTEDPREEIDDESG